MTTENAFGTNRRDFITGAAGAFFIASAGSVFGAGAPSNRVRLAIVGCRQGGRGAAVLKNAMKVPGVEIAWVCDVDSRARDFAANLVKETQGKMPKKEKDLRKVLEDKELDGIISETPDHFHAYSAILAMRAGKGVYVEKPCCFTPDEGLLMMRVAKETGATLQVGSQRRSSVSYQKAIDWLKKTNAIGEMTWAKAWYMSNRGSIGTGKKVAVPEWLDWNLWQACAPREAYRDNIVHYNWHWFRAWGTGEMGNNGPHFADVSRWALGCDTFPESVTCGAAPLSDRGGDFEWPDLHNATFRFPNGKVITFEMCCHTNVQPYMGSATGAMIYGTKGSVWFGLQDDVKVFDKDSKQIQGWAAGGVVSAESTPLPLNNPTAALDVRHLSDYVEHIRSHSQATRANADIGVKSSLLPLYANIAGDCGETLHIDPATGKCLSKAGADKWAREYAKGWELV